MVSALVLIERSGFESWSGTLRWVLRQNGFQEFPSFFYFSPQGFMQIQPCGS